MKCYTRSRKESVLQKHVVLIRTDEQMPGTVVFDDLGFFVKKTQGTGLHLGRDITETQQCIEQTIGSCQKKSPEEFL